MTISARLVIKPRKPVWCESCRRHVSGPHVRAYGMAHPGEQPWHLRVCIDCVLGHPPFERPAYVDADSKIAEMAKLLEAFYERGITGSA